MTADQTWEPGTKANPPTYYLPVREAPYLIKVGSQFVQVQVLSTGLGAMEPVGLDAMRERLMVPDAGAKPRGEK